MSSKCCGPCAIVESSCHCWKNIIIKTIIAHAVMQKGSLFSNTGFTVLNIIIMHRINLTYQIDLFLRDSLKLQVSNL